MPEQTTARAFEQYLEGTSLAAGAGTAWKLLLVEHLRRPAVQPPLVVPAVAEPQIVWIVRGRALVEERDGATEWHGGEVAPGHFFLSDSATPYELRWRALDDEPFEVLMVHVDVAVMQRASTELRGAPEYALRDVSGGADASLSAMLGLVREELARKAASPLLVEGLAHGLAVHLLRTYGEDEGPRAPRLALSAAKLRRVLAYLEAHRNEELDLGALAQHVELSPSHLSRAFHRSTGDTLSRHLVGLRVERARQLLRETSMSVIEIAIELGYASHSHFTQVFRREVGVTPTAYRNT